MSADNYETSIEEGAKGSDIESKLLALEKGGERQTRESYRADVRVYQNYLVPFRVDEKGGEQVFKISSLYKIESIPIFTSEKVYFLFQKDYLEELGMTEEFERRGEILKLKNLTAEELFNLIPSTALGALFVLAGDQSELLFNFNLAEVFTDCFRESAIDADLGYMPARAAEIKAEYKPDQREGVKETARRKIGECQKFRQLFDLGEWIILISQPTKNKLLKGEFSRDDFDLDLHGDKRIFIFSDAEALENYKNATGQSQEKLYQIKIERERIFGSDLSEYDAIFVNPYSSDALQIGGEEFKKLNELFESFEIEGRLSEINNARKKSGHYLGVAHYYLDVKKFQNFILPVDVRLKTAQTSIFNLAHVVYRRPESDYFPVFTGEDCYLAFLTGALEKNEHPEADFIEPHLIDGNQLFQILIRESIQNIVFNVNGPPEPLAFETDFALKVYCA